MMKTWTFQIFYLIGELLISLNRQRDWMIFFAHTLHTFQMSEIPLRCIQYSIEWTAIAKVHKNCTISIYYNICIKGCVKNWFHYFFCVPLLSLSLSGGFWGGKKYKFQTATTKMAKEHKNTKRLWWQEITLQHSVFL